MDWKKVIYYLKFFSMNLKNLMINLIITVFRGKYG